MDYKQEIDIIRGRLDEKELLAQLAEECCELGQAALKLCRAVGGGNPTTISSKEAYSAIIEEVADVSCCLSVLGLDNSIDRMRVAMIMKRKMERWEKRVSGDDGGDPES